MSDRARRFAVLIAAHGERRDGAGNEGVARLAAALAERGLAAEIGVGFIKGDPGIAAALNGFSVPDVLVYPLFLADGYFFRTRLPRIIAAAGEGAAVRYRVRMLPPLGVDPLLVDVVADEARRTAAAAGMDDAAAVVLLAHGTPRDPASRQAADTMACRLRDGGLFHSVRSAFLEEPPSLAEALAGIAGPAVVVGLFAGEGLHGAADVPRLITEIARPDVVFAGNVGGFAGLADVVAAAVRRASTDGGDGVD